MEDESRESTKGKAMVKRTTLKTKILAVRREHFVKGEGEKTRKQEN